LDFDKITPRSSFKEKNNLSDRRPQAENGPFNKQQMYEEEKSSFNPADDLLSVSNIDMSMSMTST